MNINERLAGRPALSAACWGLLGGVGIVLAHALSTPGIRAQMISMAYAAVVMGSSFAAKHAGGYFRRFVLGLFAFMVATLVVMIYIGLVVNPALREMPAWETALRLGFIAAFGAFATGALLMLDAVVSRSRAPSAR